jgi:uncharacterized protein YrrD
MDTQNNDNRAHFKKGAPVTNSAGEHLGSLDSVVVDPKNGDVTYLIVRKGGLFSEDKLVPFGMLLSVGDDGIALNDKAGDLDQLPAYENKYFVPAGDASTSDVSAQPVYTNPLFGNPSLSPAAILASTPNPEGYVEARTNIPPEDIVLRKGAHVVTREGTRIGDIDELLVDLDTRRITHFVIAQGVLFKTRKLIPVEWVSSVDEEVVRLAINDNALARLHDYRSA